MELIKRNYIFVSYFNLALATRGAAQGFKNLQDLVAQGKFELEAQLEPYLNFGRIVAKKLSPAVTQSNGFLSVSKMHQHRLFNVLFPETLQKFEASQNELSRLGLA